MAIKAGQILHVGGDGLVIDRIQTAGITNINVNEERLEELGNYDAVGTIRDTPDLSFEIETFDMGTEVEEMLTGGDGTLANDSKIDLEDSSVPIDIISPYKSSGAFSAVAGVVVPYLTLESASYNFSLNDVATSTFGLRGDSVFYSPGAVYRETFAGDDSTTVFNFANTAYKSTISGADYYALSAVLITDPVDGVRAQGTLTMDTQPSDGDTITIDSKTYTWQATLTDADGNIYIGADLAGAQANLVAAMDLTGTAGTDYAASMTRHPTVNMAAFAANDAVLTAKAEGTAGNSIATTETFTAGTNVFDAATLGTTTAGVNHVAATVSRQRLTDDYTNTSAAITMLTAPATGETLAVTYGSGTDDTYAQSVHTTTSPIGVRGRNIKVTLDPDGASPITFVGVQSLSVDWSITLERDEEFGNPNIVAQEASDVPEVTGTLTMKPADVDAFFLKIQQTQGLTGTDIANATQEPTAIAVDIEVQDPTTGINTKTLHIPDAKFSVPAINPSVGNKLETDFTFTSQGGTLEIYKRNRP